MVTETFYPVSVWHFLLELCSRYYDNEYNRFEFNFWISWCLDFTEWDLQLYCDLAFPSCAYLRDGGRFLPLSSQKIKNKNAWSKVIWEWPSFDSECTKLWNISVGFSWPSPISFLFTVISRQCYECLSLRSFKDCDAHRISGYCSSQACSKAKVYSASGSVYAKGCAKTCSSSAVPHCKKPGVTCEVSCCYSDNCNGSSGPVVNGILIIAIVTATFMILFGFKWVERITGHPVDDHNWS